MLEVCRYLEEQGGRVTYLPVDEFGMVDPQQVAEAITPKTILVSIMHANNEVGTIEPLEEIPRITREQGVLLHADCAQSVGKIPVRVDDLGVDLLPIAGHKVYAPKGIGALYIRSGVRLEKLMHGASHEMGWRAGTENVIEIVGLGLACELVKNNLMKYHLHMQTMRDRLEAGIGERFDQIRFNGHPEKRLPNTLSASFRGMRANIILEALEGVYASAGAACHSDHVEVSSVLEAMQVPLEYAMGTLAVLGRPVHHGGRNRSGTGRNYPSGPPVNLVGCSRRREPGRPMASHHWLDRSTLILTGEQNDIRGRT